jgi:hypothetical protein
MTTANAHGLSILQAIINRYTLIIERILMLVESSPFAMYKNTKIKTIIILILS